MHETGELVKRILGEQMLPIGEVPGVVPQIGGRPAVDRATAHRWATRGCPGPDGSRVKLDVIRLGGRLVTSKEAVLRFLVALQPAEVAGA